MELVKFSNNKNIDTSLYIDHTDYRPAATRPSRQFVAKTSVYRLTQY